MKRRDDWPERLAAFFASRTVEPFAWGKNDCALFVCDAVLEMTGLDMAAAFRGYDSERGAAKVIARYGGLLQLARAMAAEHGCEEIPPAFCYGTRRGDVCLVAVPVAGEDVEALGVMADGFVFALSPDGLLRLRREVVKAAWRIG